MASLIISISANILARKRKKPITVFIASGIIPLVPGAGMFQTMYALINGNTKETTKYGLETLQVAGVIAIAIALVITYMNNRKLGFKSKSKL